MRIASVLSWLLGLGFGLPGIYGLWYFAHRHQVWSFLGFPTYGKGPFTKIGIETSTPLLGIFVLLCVAEAVVGWVLWQLPSAGGKFALLILPLELIFWIGFALPYGLILGIARTILVVVYLARH